MREREERENDVSQGREAHRQLMRLAKLQAAVDAEIGRWLLVARDARVHVEHGYGTFLEYVERVLGYRPRTTLDRLRVAEELARLPEIHAALEHGAVTYSAVREITRIAEPETEAEWVAAVAGKTMREVEQATVGRERGDRPGDPQKPAITPRALRLELAPEVYALFVQARRIVEDEAGERLDDSGVMAAICQRIIDGSEQAGTRPRHQIAISTCQECERSTQDAAGQVIEIGSDALALARCDATHVHLDDANAPVTTEIPERIRRHVERRDQLRCSVPGCRSSRELHIHHIIWRAHLGTHDPGNLVLVCGNHHRAIHNGHLHVSGTAPDELHFHHADGRPYGVRVIEPVPPERAHVGTLAELSAFVDECLARGVQRRP